MLCASTALLPSRWFPIPAWRKSLEALPIINLPPTVSIVPWQTAFWLAMLGLSAMVGFFFLAQPVRSRGLLVLAVAMVLVCAVYAALAIYAKRFGWHYPYAGGAAFGFFPNRNHTATFLITGSILAMSVLRVVLRERRWLLALATAAGLTVCVVALFFFSASRGGVVFLVVGTILWIGGLGRVHRSTSLVVSVGALLVAAGVLFLASGSEVRNRLFGSAEHSSTTLAQERAGWSADGSLSRGNAQDLSSDDRLKIYRDTLSLIRDFPLTGIGMGSFGGVFAQYRKASLNEALPIHPESDWLMLAAEAGAPALLCLLILCRLLAGRLSAWQRHPYWPLRWGCVAAALAAVLHGFVDVPAHRMGLSWWILILVGLGFQTPLEKFTTRSRVQHVLFVLGGLGSLALGVQLIRAEWFGALPLPPCVAIRAQKEVAGMFDRHDTEGAMNQARVAVSASPFSAPLYYQLGVLLLHFQDTDAEVDQVFEAERLLNPTWSQVPLRQGEAWSTVDPGRTASLWLDALERRQRIDRVRNAPADGGVDYYRDLLRRAKTLPAVQRALAGVATQSPAFALAWLDGVNPEIASEQLGLLASRAGLLSAFSQPERQRFLLGWYTKGNREAMLVFLSEHPEWTDAAWQTHVRQLVDSRRFEEAVHETANHYHVSLTLPGPGSTVSAVDLLPPSDPTVEEFERYWRSGNTIAARRALSEAGGGTDAASVSPKYWWLRTAVAIQDSDWAQAWQCLERYLAQKPPVDVLP